MSNTATTDAEWQLNQRNYEHMMAEAGGENHNGRRGGSGRRHHREAMNYEQQLLQQQQQQQQQQYAAGGSHVQHQQQQMGDSRRKRQTRHPNEISRVVAPTTGEIRSGHLEVDTLYGSGGGANLVVNSMNAPNNSTVQCGCENIDCPFCNLMMSVQMST